MPNLSKIRKCTIFALLIAMYVLMFFPTMDAYCDKGEGCNLVVRIYNFLEFSGISVFVIIAPFLLILLAVADLPGTLGCVSVISVTAIDFAALVLGMKSSYIWLTENATSHVNLYMPGFLEIILLVAATALLVNERGSYCEDTA